MRTVEHGGAVAQGRGVRQLFLAGLFDDAIELPERANGLLEADRVADLDRAGQGFPGLNRLKGLEVALGRLSTSRFVEALKL